MARNGFPSQCVRACSSLLLCALSRCNRVDCMLDLWLAFAPHFPTLQLRVTPCIVFVSLCELRER